MLLRSQARQGSSRRTRRTSASASGDAAAVAQKKPFPIKRIFWTYDIRDGNMRGDHAHRTCQMVLFPIGGSFDIELDDGCRRETLRMDDPSQGVFIPPLVWCRLMNFTPNAACISLASEEYRAEDYIHDYEEFIALTNKD